MAHMKNGICDPESLISLIREKQAGADRFLITIDGPCASGKTTLARMLSEALQASVFHTDDFVIPHPQKTAERLSIPGGNCDSDRLAEEVISPWKQGLEGEYRRYDFRADALMPPQKLPDTRIMILEGSYCNLPVIRKFADLRIFVETPESIRSRRLQERESPKSLAMFHRRWIPLENAYFTAFGLPDSECLIFKESPGEPESEREQ